MKPIIGIIGNSDISTKEKNTICVFDNYRKAIIKYGGVPILILPPQLVNYENDEVGHLTNLDIEILNLQLKLCDGFVLQGGTRRFEYHTYICEYANKNKIPLLGICMGMQTMCNYNNDNKNILNENEMHKSPDLDEVHEIIINKDSNLYKIIGQEKFIVNSNHNFHVPNSGSYKAAGLSDDNLIEAVEKEGYFSIGVQWHPEKKYESVISNKLFTSFIEACKKDSKLKNPL